MGSELAPRSGRANTALSYIYMILFSMRFNEAFWVIYLSGRGLSFATIGLLETVFHVASVFGEIPTGWIADRFGRRVSLMVGRAVSAIAAAAMLIARGPLGFGLAFCLSAWSYNCHSGAYDAFVYDEMKADGRSAEFTRVMGLINALYLIGGAAAAAFGGFVARRALELLYLLSIGVDLVALGVLAPLRERPIQRSAEEPRKLSFLRDLRELGRDLRDGRLAGLLVLWGITGALSASASMYGQSYLQGLGVGLVSIGFIGMLRQVVAVIPTTQVYRAERRFGANRTLFVSSVAVPVALLLTGLLPGHSGRAAGLIGAMGLIVISALTEGQYPLFNSAINALVPSERRATVLSSGSLLFSLGMMVIFPLIGVAGDAVGLGSGFAIAAVGVMLLGAMTALGLLVRSRRAGKEGRPAVAESQLGC